MISGTSEQSKFYNMLAKNCYSTFSTGHGRIWGNTGDETADDKPDQVSKNPDEGSTDIRQHIRCYLSHFVWMIVIK